MTKKLKLKAKIIGDTYWYDVTEFDDGEEICVYDKRNGQHLDFSWDMIQGFISENPKLINVKTIKH